jgi:hypothetical protein
MFHLATECTPPKVQFVPYIPMLKENNVRTGFVETGFRIRLEQACAGIGLWRTNLDQLRFVSSLGFGEHAPTSMGPLPVP